MSLEHEMRIEIGRLEKEINFIDDELEKIKDRLEKLLMIRKKKERDLRVLKSNFGEEPDTKDIQTTLAKLIEKTR